MYRRKKNLKLLLEACTPREDVEEALKELYEERRGDERKYNRYLSA